MGLGHKQLGFVSFMSFECNSKNDNNKTNIRACPLAENNFIIYSMFLLQNVKL